MSSMLNEENQIKSQPAMKMKRRVNVFLLALLSLFPASMLHSTLKAQEKPTKREHGYITESMARERAKFIVMPGYSGELPGDKITVVIKAKIEIDVAGKVIRAAVQPGQYPLLREAVFNAIKQWTFEPFVPSYTLQDSTHISRLTFVYIVENNEGRVEMYTPPLDAKPFDRLDGLYPPTELKEWQQWVDIYNRQHNFGGT
jgi:flagellar basal body-associated protein FliL